MKLFRRLIIIVLIGTVSILFGVSALAEEPCLTVYFLDVGQADSAIIICDDKVLMIDGDNAADSQFIYSMLRNTLDIQTIDYMIASHPHEDHVGGLAAALNACFVGVLYTPETDYPSKAWNNVLKYAEAQGTPVVIPMPGDTFEAGSAKVDILGPMWFSNNTNNMSLIVRITYGNVTFLFTGDAEREEEQDLVEADVPLQADVLKVSHHGSNSSSGDVFLGAVKPRYAVVSVGADNQYGHPAEEVLGRLIDAGAEIYRTDLQGTIICKTNGTYVEFRTEK